MDKSLNVSIQAPYIYAEHENNTEDRAKGNRSKGYELTTKTFMTTTSMNVIGNKWSGGSLTREYYIDPMYWLMVNNANMYYASRTASANDSFVSFGFENWGTEEQYGYKPSLVYSYHGRWS